MSTDNQIAQHTPQPSKAVATGSVFSGMSAFEDAQRMAKALSSSTLVPNDYKGNISNTLIAMEMAQRTNTSPMAVMQNMYVIHGKPSWSSKFIIAAINGCGRFSPLRFKVTGNKGDETCVAYSTDIQSGDILEGVPVSIAMAKAEGWMNKAGSKWKTMPLLMLNYRAATFFGNMYAPDILMGIHTVDEQQDIQKVNAVSNLNDSLQSPPPINEEVIHEAEVIEVVQNTNKPNQRDI